MVYFRIKIKCGNITSNHTKKIGKKKDMKVFEIASNFEGDIAEFLEHENNDGIDDVGEDSSCSLNEKNDADVNMSINRNVIENENKNKNENSDSTINNKNNNVMNEHNNINNDDSKENVEAINIDNKVGPNIISDTATLPPSATSNSTCYKSHRFSDWNSVAAAHLIDMWADLMGVKTLGSQLGGKNPGV